MSTYRLFTIGSLLLLIIANANGQVLDRVLSHNDYEQERPLYGALDNKINYVEVDIALQNDKLYVTHELSEIKEENTFESMYLEPLKEIIKKNGGFVYEKNVGPFVLYINTKTGGETINRINDQLSKYKKLITSFSKGKRKTRPILVIGGGASGMSDDKRYLVAEGNLETPKDTPASTVYMTNLWWRKYFSWNGKGNIPEAELSKLREFVKTVHEQGRILRFWGNPDIISEYGENFWNTILNEGVDVLSTDFVNDVGGYFRNKNSQ